MSLDLKNTINNTNLEKENLKKAKNNINNKLVALGGEASLDLNNTPQKIENLIKKQYKKIAIGTATKSWGTSTYYQETSINIPLTFIPSLIIFEIKKMALKNGYQYPNPKYNPGALEGTLEPVFRMDTRAKGQNVPIKVFNSSGTRANESFTFVNYTNNNLILKLPTEGGSVEVKYIAVE